ncbi:torsin-1A-interacting protein 2-like [Spea bombifrons]|uniref:torsin-1A-interacting protein 2-like n=1 Tax=Spea bombifrons TaxID=233779 RepID=UPI002349606B|nr:torsin-1A-interacting protein 2-like [Spea bombifrons]
MGDQQPGADAEKEKGRQRGADAEKEKGRQRGADAEKEKGRQRGADAEKEKGRQPGADAEKEKGRQPGADAEKEALQQQPAADTEKEKEQQPGADVEKEALQQQPAADAIKEAQQHGADAEMQDQQPGADTEKEKEQQSHGADVQKKEQHGANAEKGEQQRGADAEEEVYRTLLRHRHAGTNLEVKRHLTKDTVYPSNTMSRMEEMSRLSTCKPGPENESCKNYTKVATVFLVIIAFTWYFLRGSNQTVDSSTTVLKRFQNEFESLMTDFPGQNRHLWLRSQKMLQRHLNKSHPMEPATLILAAARDGEHTLRCLSGRLARAYSVSLNATYLVIDASTKGNYDSMTTKLHLDETLSSGFESTSRAAVLHRLEKLPSGSLLILYKYCDHENAAFKNVALVLTILLEEPTLEVGLSLREIEEKVKDFLWERFTKPNSVSSHSEMDVDKLSGVWSRISHLVLPVLPVDPLESSICPLEPE